MGNNLCKPEFDVNNDGKPALIQPKFIKSGAIVTDEALELSFLDKKSTTSIITQDVRNFISSTKEVIKTITNQKLCEDDLLTDRHPSDSKASNNVAYNIDEALEAN